jgi:hypothetical protein
MCDLTDISPGQSVYNEVFHPLGVMIDNVEITNNVILELILVFLDNEPNETQSAFASDWFFDFWAGNKKEFIKKPSRTGLN